MASNSLLPPAGQFWGRSSAMLARTSRQSSAARRATAAASQRLFASSSAPAPTTPRASSQRRPTALARQPCPSVRITPPPAATFRVASNTNAPASASSWTPPTEEELDRRPVLIIGAGNLGRRMAMVWASARRPVVLYDTSPAALKSAIAYISDNLGTYCAEAERHPGHVSHESDLAAACASQPWMVIEALPENLELKKKVLAEAERLVPGDCLLATNSSSFRSAEMVQGAGGDGVATPGRLLNTHYYIPPRNRFVELMSSGATADAVFPFLARQMEGVGLRPLVLPRHAQSTGFVFNRVWAAVKRETLAVLAEGVARPADVDALFRDFFHAEKGPCERMDEVGLDVVRAIEEHYIAERATSGGKAGDSRPALEWLTREYVDRGRLGEKTGDGLYTAAERAELAEHRRWEKHGRLEDESRGA